MITLNIDGPVATATLCRPPVNAINDEWIQALDAVLDEVEHADEVGVLWIRSAMVRPPTATVRRACKLAGRGWTGVAPAATLRNWPSAS